MRPLARRLVDSAPFDRVLRILEGADHGRSDALGVLTYHRVAPEPTRGYPGLISATPEELDDQLEHLGGRFHIATLDEVLDVRDGGRPLPRRSILLTFDDAYVDFEEHAWPVLRRRRAPATLFVPTDYPGHPDRSFWWDWLHDAIMAADPTTEIDLHGAPMRLRDDFERLGAYRMLRGVVKEMPHEEAMGFVASVAGDRLQMPRPSGMVLDWDRLRALAGDGVKLAPHSRTHALLDRLDPERLDDEVAGSWEDLRREVGATPAAFAYPSGSWSPEVRAAVDRAGLRLAFTTRRGLNRLGTTDWLGLRRLNVGRSSSVNVLRAQLGRWALAWSR